MVSCFFATSLPFYLKKKCHHESRTPQHSKWNCVGTNRPRHCHMNAPKVRIVQKKIAAPKFEFETANQFHNHPKPFEIIFASMQYCQPTTRPRIWMWTRWKMWTRKDIVSEKERFKLACSQSLAKMRKPQAPQLLDFWVCVKLHATRVPWNRNNFTSGATKVAMVRPS